MTIIWSWTYGFFFESEFIFRSAYNVVQGRSHSCYMLCLGVLQQVDEQGKEIKREPTPRKQEMTPLFVMMKALGMASYNNPPTLYHLYYTCNIFSKCVSFSGGVYSLML